jgi:hypothetical protein
MAASEGGLMQWARPRPKPQAECRNACGQAQERSGGTCSEQKERNGASTRSDHRLNVVKRLWLSLRIAQRRCGVRVANRAGSGAHSRATSTLLKECQWLSLWNISINVVGEWGACPREVEAPHSGHHNGDSCVRGSGRCGQPRIAQPLS